MASPVGASTGMFRCHLKDAGDNRKIPFWHLPFPDSLLSAAGSECSSECKRKTLSDVFWESVAGVLIEPEHYRYFYAIFQHGLLLVAQHCSEQREAAFHTSAARLSQHEIKGKRRKVGELTAHSSPPVRDINITCEVARKRSVLGRLSLERFSLSVAEKSEGGESGRSLRFWKEIVEAEWVDNAS